MNKSKVLFDFLLSCGLNEYVIEKDTKSVFPIPENSHLHEVFDRRSMLYYAMGLSQQLIKPVVVCANNLDASCADLLPGLTEAFYQNVPLIVLLFQNDIGWLDDIDKVLGDKCKHKVSIYSEDWEKKSILTIKVNTALSYIEKGGPVLFTISQPKRNINYQRFDRISYIFEEQLEKEIHNLEIQLQNNNSVIVLDESEYYSLEDIKKLNLFCKYNKCSLINGNVFTLEELSYNNKDYPSLIVYLGKADYIPEIEIKNIWLVNKELSAKCLINPNLVIACSWRDFINLFCEKYGNDNKELTGSFYCKQPNNKIERVIDSIQNYIIEKTWFYGNYIPKGIIKNKYIDCICSKAPTGKDGIVSIFIGHCIASNPTPNFLFTDMNSFMRDMNALHIQHIHSNCRICVFVDNSIIDGSTHILSEWAISNGFSVFGENQIQHFVNRKSTEPQLLIVYV